MIYHFILNEDPTVLSTGQLVIWANAQQPRDVFYTGIFNSSVIFIYLKN